MAVELKLKELGIELPEASKAAANYSPYVKIGNQIVVSGQIPFLNGSLDKGIGKVGRDFDAEEAKEVARICAINILAQVKQANNSLDNVRCVKLGVFVNAVKDFKDHPFVANGASDLMVEILGDNGVHARSAVGVASLPFGVAVEIDAIFEVI